MQLKACQVPMPVLSKHCLIISMRGQKEFVNLIFWLLCYLWLAAKNSPNSQRWHLIERVYTLQQQTTIHQPLARGDSDSCILAQDQEFSWLSLSLFTSIPNFLATNECFFVHLSNYKEPSFQIFHHGHYQQALPIFCFRMTDSIVWSVAGFVFLSPVCAGIS